MATDRRQFFGYAALAVATLGRQSRAGAGPRPRSVIVIGAGLAGLAAADDLVRAGHAVIVLEARSRPGGRVRTLRQPFDAGLHAEAGALFVPDHHALTLRYVRRFGLPLDPATRRGATEVYHVRGRRLAVAPGRQVAWPVPLTAEERRLGLFGMWEKYLGATLDDLGDVTAADWPPAALLERYDTLSGAELLRNRGASPGAIDLLRLGYLDLSGDGLDTGSALFMLRDLALRRAETRSYTIGGGNDRLPAALAAGLAHTIVYDAPVVRIEPGERSAAVVVRHGGTERRLTAGRVLCTLPFSVLRGIEVSPAFPAPKRAAVATLPYTSVTRVLLQVRRRFWLDDGIPAAASTDLGVKWIWDATAGQHGTKAILDAYAAGAAARRLAALGETERVASARADVARVYPGGAESFERSASACWDDDPAARGAYAWFRPGQMRALLPVLATPVGCVHFAGEHTSPWAQWMQGALESGVRAAREIREAGA